MDITIACIGKMKQSPEKELVLKYLKQTRWNVSIKEFEEKKNLSCEERKKKEAELLLSAVPSCAKVIVLDERGKQISSQSFSQTIQKWQNEGISSLAFLIGGADGHSEEVRQKAHLLLGLGAMTWPHMLARVMLLEQIYRAKSILDGHPYHRE